MLLVLAGSVPLSSQQVSPISPLTLLRSKAFPRPFSAAHPDLLWSQGQTNLTQVL